MAVSLYSDYIACRRVLRHAKDYWTHIAGIILLSLLGPALALLYPLPLKIAVDSFLGSRAIPKFLNVLLPSVATRSATGILSVAAGLLVAIAVVGQLQKLGISFLSKYTGERLGLNFRAEIFRHVQRLSISYHESKGTADSTYRILTDASAIQDIVIDGAIPLLSACVMFAGLLYVTARLDFGLVLVALAISPFLLLFSRLYRGRLRSQWREVKNAESSLMSTAQEVLGTLRVVKAFAREEQEQERFVRQSSQGVQARLRLALLQRQLSFLTGLTMAVGQAAVLFIGIHHVRSGVLSLGELLMVMTYLRRLYDPLKTSTQKAANLQSSLASAERVFALLDQAPDVVERPDARPVSRAAGRVSFCNVSFGYTKDHPVLREISFEVKTGARVRILGASGAGKTTLMYLLTRFYDPAVGRIVLDGVDLRDYQLADLRNQFSIVLQESVLFSTGIAENIAYARPTASHQEIVRAAKAANAHDFIVNLPQSYATKVGERGMCLSGGERQRIGLARAFLKDAPILILDEPTSSVDLRSEVAIMEAMERLMRNRTTFLIAHRLGALKTCDLVVRLEGGRLVPVTSEASIGSPDAYAFGV